jgi:hypothetical protein
MPIGIRRNDEFRKGVRANPKERSYLEEQLVNESHYADPLSYLEAQALQKAELTRAPPRPTTTKPYGGSRSRRLRTKQKSKLLTKLRRNRQSRTKRRNLFGAGYNCTSGEVERGKPDDVIDYGAPPPIDRKNMPKPYTRTLIEGTNTYTDGRIGPDGKPIRVFGGGEFDCTQAEIDARRRGEIYSKGGYKRLSLKTKQKRRSKKSRK